LLFGQTLTLHVIVSAVLLDPHTATLIWTLLRRTRDFVFACVVVDLAFAALALVVLCASSSGAESLVVYSADHEVARDAAEDISFGTAVMNLARIESSTEAVTDVRDVAEDAADGDFIVSNQTD
jgi:hypothetical protein